MNRKWKMDKPERWQKEFHIQGPVMDLIVDYDDVPHEEVLKEAKRITKILNSADSK